MNMERPKICNVKINWIDEKGNEHNETFHENTLEELHDLIGLMIGDISESDLEA